MKIIALAVGAICLIALSAIGQTNVTPAQWLALQPKPYFKQGHRLALLSKFSWPTPFDLRKEMADNWGYALDMQDGDLVNGGLASFLANTNSTPWKVINLATNNPGKYRLQVDVDRIWPTNLSRGFWVTNASGQFVDRYTNTWDSVTNTTYTKVVSPEAPDADLIIQAEALAEPFEQLVAMGVDIGIIMNGGERDLGVIGFDRNAWKQDPRVQLTGVFTNTWDYFTNATGLSWPRYISDQKGRHLLHHSDALRAAVPDRQLYVWYNNGNEQVRFNQPGYDWENGWANWSWHSDELDPAMDILSYESYFVGSGGPSYTNIVGAAWNQVTDLLTRQLAGVGSNLRIGHTTNYAFVCGGWSNSNSNRLSEMPRYTGLLKCLYTSGTIGATAGYFEFPTNTVPTIFGHSGFTGSFPTNNPPHWLQQIKALSDVHGMFSHLDHFIYEGALLPGPTNHFVCRDISAYEFPNAEFDPHVRTLVRKLNATNEWLVTAWCAAGSARSVNVTVPTLGTIQVAARPEGSVYRATPNSLQQLDGPPPSSGNHWYLKPDAAGLSSNTGTSWAHAWTNAGQVVWGGSGVKAGDTLWIGSGVDTNRLNIQASGTATNYIRIWMTTDPDHAGSGYTMTGPQGRISINSNDYLWLRGANTNAGAPLSLSHGVTNAVLTTNLPPMIHWTVQQTNVNTVGSLGQNCEGVIIEFIEFDGSPDGTTVASQDGNTAIAFNGTDMTGTNWIRYCYIHDMGQDGISGNNSPRASINELIIENNYITRLGDDGIEWSGGATVRGNRIQKTTGQNGHPDAIQCPHDYWHIEGNIIGDFNTGLIYGGTRHYTNRYFYAINNFLYMQDTNATQHPIQAINMDQTLLEYGALTNYYFSDIVISGNTIVNCNGGISFANRFAIGTSTNGNGQPYTNWLNIAGLKMENNVFVGASNATSVGMSMKGLGHEGIIYTDTPVIRNNILSGNTSVRQVIWNGVTYADIVGYTAASGHGTGNSTNQPAFKAVSSGDYSPGASDTMLIDAGLDLSAYFTSDITGRDRDLPFDIGAFEYIPEFVETNLLVHLTFEDDFTSDTQIDDSSGFGHHGLKYGISTNQALYWPWRTNDARVGSYAGAFTPNYSDRPYTDTNFWSGRYFAITNVHPRLTNMPLATVAVWAKFNSLTNGQSSTSDHNATFLDTGYGVRGAWHFGRYYSTSIGNVRLLINTNAGSIASATQLVWSNGTYTNDTWHHYAFTVNATDNTNIAVKLYLDGSNIYSTNLPLQSASAITGLRMTDAPGSTYGQWLSGGAWQHNGTPTLDDAADGLPNNGWMNGQMDDVRVYDRQLSDSEILTLYGEESETDTQYRKSVRGARMLIGGRRR
jgi:hypothetical protein